MAHLPDVSVLVVSCDPYEDLWDPFFVFFKRYWPDCQYPIYLQTNHLQYQDSTVATIGVGDDVDWSSNLQRSLDQIPSKYVLLLLEDFFLCRPVDTLKIQQLVSVMVEKNAAYCRLVPKPPADTKLSYSLNLGSISKGENYRVSFQAGIWDKSVLKNLLQSGENAWMAEMQASKRSNAIDALFLSLCRAPYEEWPLHYMNAVIKRKWTPEAVKFCRDNAVQLDMERRQVCTAYDQLRRKRIFRKMIAFSICIIRFFLGEKCYKKLKSHSILKKIIY